MYFFSFVSFSIFIYLYLLSVGLVQPVLLRKILVAGGAWQDYDMTS